VYRSTVGRWEAGETTPLPWFRPKLAKALSVSIDELDAMLAEGQMDDDGGSPGSAESPADGQLGEGDAAHELPEDPAPYVTALRATHSAGDRPLGTHTSVAWPSRRPVRASPPRPSRSSRQLLLVRGAKRSRACWPNSTVGKPMRSRRWVTCRGATALSQLRTQIERLTPGAGPSWLYWVGQGNMTGEVGNALRQLGHTEQAATVLENSIAMLDDSRPGSRAGYLIHLANTLVRPGKQRGLEAAADRGMEAIQLIENLDSARLTGLIRILSHQLAPFARLSAVRDFLARARGLMTV